MKGGNVSKAEKTRKSSRDRKRLRGKIPRGRNRKRKERKEVKRKRWFP